MRWGPAPRRARLVARHNLFLAMVEPEGRADRAEPLACFLANPGRLPELTAAARTTRPTPSSAPRCATDEAGVVITAPVPIELD